MKTTRENTSTPEEGKIIEWDDRGRPLVKGNPIIAFIEAMAQGPIYGLRHNPYWTPP